MYANLYSFLSVLSTSVCSTISDNPKIEQTDAPRDCKCLCPAALTDDEKVTHERKKHS